MRKLLGSLLMIGTLGTAMPARADESALDKIKQAGTMKVCVAQISPESYKDSRSGEWRGVMIDLVKELADWMKVKPEWVEVTYDIAVLSLKRGDCDFFGGSIVYNAPRAMEINYIKPLWAKGSNVVLPNASDKFKTMSDLNRSGVTLAVLAGSSENEVAKRLFPEATLLALKATQPAQILDSVKRGDADGGFLPALTIKWWLAVPENRAWGKLGFPDGDVANAPNGWAVRYGDPGWKNFLDSFAEWAVASQLVNRLYAHYLELSNPFTK
ncbi:MAG: transporter substrate-binding domain-containing protein [Pseudomonadota bacterium]